MNHRVIRPLLVEQDLQNAAEYIARHNLDAAIRFLDAAENDFQFLAAMPTLGSPWESSRPEQSVYRTWPVRGFENYIIVYRPVRHGVAIVRVIHGARDIKSILANE
jgi:toxin ParE1/3/4